MAHALGELAQRSGQGVFVEVFDGGGTRTVAAARERQQHLQPVERRVLGDQLAHPLGRGRLAIEAGHCLGHGPQHGG